MKGFLFAPGVTRHPIWTPSLGQTTTVVTTTTSPAAQGYPGEAGLPKSQGGGINLLSLAIVSGAVLVVTEALGITHVTKWFTKTIGLSKK